MTSETEALRHLARQMAAVADPAALLNILCTAAATHCAAAGAAVVKVVGAAGEVVAGTGNLAVATGRNFPLRGSMLRDLYMRRDIVTIDDFTRSERPLARVVPDLAIGPMLVAPLVTHQRLLGGLVVARPLEAEPFSEPAVERLRVIADHAALAVWKSDILAQAAAADQAKGQFIATISHELRTPLTALTGYQELLADEVLGPLSEQQADVIDRMRSVTHHLTAMIEEVLTFSNIEAGKEVVREAEFLAHDLVRAVVAIVEPLAQEKGLDLVTRLPDEPLRLTTDADKIRQILVNLAGNAIKFTDAGVVEIRLCRQADQLRVAVRDTGIGIAPEHLESLFQPFTQLDTGLTRRHGGTGLGLYISRRLAELLGGRIEVESTHGQGSEFTLILP